MKGLYSVFLYIVCQLPLAIIIYKYDGRNLACTAAGRSRFRSLDLCRRSDSLAGNLHKTELGKRQNIVLGPVIVHQFLHLLQQGILVLAQVHIYEVYDDDSTHVPQLELAGDFLCRHTVDIVGVLLLVLTGLYPGSAVDIHHMHGLSMFYNQICSLSHRDYLPERGFYLTGHVEVVKNGLMALIQFYNLFVVRQYSGGYLSNSWDKASSFT